MFRNNQIHHDGGFQFSVLPSSRVAPSSLAVSRSPGSSRLACAGIEKGTQVSWRPKSDREGIQTRAGQRMDGLLYLREGIVGRVMASGPGAGSAAGFLFKSENCIYSQPRFPKNVPEPLHGRLARRPSLAYLRGGSSVFRAKKLAVRGAYCNLWVIPRSSYIPIRIRELGTGNCCSEAKGLPMANPPTRRKRPTRQLGML